LSLKRLGLNHKLPGPDDTKIPFEIPANIRFAIAFPSTGRKGKRLVKHGIPAQRLVASMKFSSEPTKTIPLKFSLCLSKNWFMHRCRMEQDMANYSKMLL
jgi:hypothetical protein